MSSHVVSTIALGLFSLSIAAGCSSSVAEDGRGDDSLTGDDAEVRARSECGAAFAEAQAEFGQAVEAAGETFALTLCLSPGERSVQDHAASAVLLCPAFKDVIRTSPAAAGIREVLGSLLTLRSLTGELAVLREADVQDWSNVERYLPGTKMWSVRRSGVDQDAIRFEEGGKVSLAHAVETGPLGELDLEIVEGKYEVERTGSERDRRTVLVTWPDKVEQFDLVVRPTARGDVPGAPVFVLAHPDEARSYSTHVECSM